MNNQFTTQDTGEVITAPQLPADDRTGTGYDWMETLTGTPWATLANWGSDGSANEQFSLWRAPAGSWTISDWGRVKYAYRVPRFVPVSIAS